MILKLVGGRTPVLRGSKVLFLSGVLWYQSSPTPGSRSDSHMQRGRASHVNVSDAHMQTREQGMGPSLCGCGQGLTMDLVQVRVHVHFPVHILSDVDKRSKPQSVTF